MIDLPNIPLPNYPSPGNLRLINQGQKPYILDPNGTLQEVAVAGSTMTEADIAVGAALNNNEGAQSITILCSDGSSVKVFYYVKEAGISRKLQLLGFFDNPTLFVRQTLTSVAREHLIALSVDSGQLQNANNLVYTHLLPALDAHSDWLYYELSTPPPASNAYVISTTLSQITAITASTLVGTPGYQGQLAFLYGVPYVCARTRLDTFNRFWKQI